MSQNQSLIDFRRLLNEGILLSKQTSYERRAPDKAALPILTKVRIGLIRNMEENEPTEETWRLLAQTEECFLNYTAALRCLERAMNLSKKRDKRDLKKIALYREYDTKWKSLGITPAQLAELGEFLNNNRNSFKRDFTLTRQWLANQNVKSVECALEAFRSSGVYNDFQVLANLVS